MVLDARKLKKVIRVAGKKEAADLVIKNGRIVDVFNGEVVRGDVAIADGVFAGIGTFEGKDVVDAQNKFICPGLIDGHVHIEAALVTPKEFAKAVLPHGVTTVVADPHEIANVGGSSAIEYMLEASEGLPLTVYIMLPSSVPASETERSGAVLGAEQLRSLYAHERVIGLGEVMDYPAVAAGEDEMMAKLADARNRKASIDGHAAGLDEDGINVYTAAGIRSDHECNTVAGARDRLRRGMYLMIREGSVTRDLEQLISVVNERNSRRCLFVTDGKDLEDIETEGSINYNIRRAVQHGIEPLTAIQMGTLNAAECFQLRGKGAIAPGYDADFLLLDDLERMAIFRVYSGGALVAEHGVSKVWPVPHISPPALLTRSVHMADIQENQLDISLNKPFARVIGIKPNSLFTDALVERVETKGGLFQPSVRRDQLKLVVCERHKRTGKVGVGIVKGFGLESGAIASTFAHDSHNVIAAGTNDRDLLAAIHCVRDMNGGFAIVQRGAILASLPLPIAGLMADRDGSFVLERLQECRAALETCGSTPGANPFIALSFLALPVIPELKLTADGLFDVRTSRHIDIQADEEAIGQPPAL